MDLEIKRSVEPAGLAASSSSLGAQPERIRQRRGEISRHRPTARVQAEHPRPWRRLGHGHEARLAFLRILDDDLVTGSRDSMEGERPFESLPVLIVLEDRLASVAAPCARKFSEFMTLVALEALSAQANGRSRRDTRLSACGP